MAPRTAPLTADRQVFRAATLVMALFFLSRMAGLAREMIIGARFGTSAELDAYLAAFRVPDLLFQLMAGGALGSAFIPVFTGCLTRRDLTGGWRLFSAITNLVLIVMTGLAVAAAVTAPWLVSTLLAPGFTPEQQALTVSLMRWMLVSTIIFGVSGIMMGVLNSFQHFLLPALSPLLYNLSIIAGAWFLAPEFGVYGLVIGVVDRRGAALASSTHRALAGRGAVPSGAGAGRCRRQGGGAPHGPQGARPGRRPASLLDQHDAGLRVDGGQPLVAELCVADHVAAARHRGASRGHGGLSHLRRAGGERAHAKNCAA